MQLVCATTPPSSKLLTIVPDSIHDLTLAEFAKNDVRLQGRRGERGKAGSKHSHCWAYVQGLCHVQDCQYLHPVAVHMCECTPLSSPISTQGN